MQKPLILLTMSYKHKPGKDPQVVLNTAYAQAILQAGGLPLCCPYGTDEALQYAELADGLLLTGGMDIEPARYGQQPINDTVEPTPNRDDFEYALLEAYAKRRRPILGICRGLQLLNTFLGGTLYQDLPAQLGVSCHSSTQSGVFASHPVVAEEGFWKEQFGGRFVVNSYHHQAVRDLAPGLVATVRAEDGVIEACGTADGLWQCCQWHPERMVAATADTPSMLPVFTDFVARCR